MLHTFQDINGPSIETLERPPNALEFSRLAHISRPVVIKGKYKITTKASLQIGDFNMNTGYQIPARHIWTDEYLEKAMDGYDISVAITPNGYVL
jgi:peptidyl-lysine (3S)-dioxygenase / protease